MMRKICFVCPACKKEAEIEEILVQARVVSVLTGLEKGKLFQYKVDPLVEEGEVLKYQCYSCGESLKNKKGKDITDMEELYKHLRKHGFLEGVRIKQKQRKTSGEG